MKRAIILSAAAAAIVIVIWLFFADGNGTQQVETSPAERGDITRLVSAVGSVRALTTVEVGSQLSGQISQVRVDFNSEVKAGDLLAVIDPQTFERRVQEAAANLAVARADVAIQTAGIERARASLANTQREYQRQQALVKDGSVSRSALDAAEAAFKIAEADVAIGIAQQENAQATVQQREASFEAARIDLQRTEIRSPIDGVVIDRAIDVGQTVAASLAAPILFTIANDLTEIQIEANVDEADIGNVRAGAAVRFGVDAFPEDDFTGRVAQVRLAPVEEQNVVTYTVIITARNADRRLLPGMTANVEIVAGQRTNVLRAANAALRFKPSTAQPSGVPPAAGGQPPGGFQGGGVYGEVLDRLGLEARTRRAIADEISALFAARRAGFADPNADRDALRAQMQNEVRAVLQARLTAEQWTAAEAELDLMQSSRPATLYVLTAGGEIEARQVRLGIGDERFTEIIAGDVKEGDRLVTRVRATTAR